MKNKKKKKSGFTLIELLAVIIILGVLMVIAVPAVTKYINQSKESSYIDSAKGIINGARILANSETLGMTDTDTTYYIPAKYIKSENGMKSPYGEFTEAYVAIVHNEKEYQYYWISNDESGHGIPYLTEIDKLDNSLIQTDIKDIDIRERVEATGVGDRKKILILGDNEVWSEEKTALVNTNGDVETSDNDLYACIPATTLHTITCANTNQYYGCAASGYTGSNSTIVYGTIVNGTPKTGDAYDCKVTRNGGYTERFYYVKSDGDNSILIYYKNLTKKPYDLSNENWHGPRDGYKYLPNKSVWDNPKFIEPGTRNIVTNTGNASTPGGTIEAFTYTGKIARFLSYQDIQQACNKTTLEKLGTLKVCNWLFENISFYEDGSLNEYGYWLETPSNIDGTNTYVLLGSESAVANPSKYEDIIGIRPVITVKTSDLGTQ